MGEQISSMIWKKSVFGRGVIRIRVLRHLILKSFWTHFWGKPYDLYLRSSAAGPVRALTEIAFPSKPMRATPRCDLGHAISHPIDSDGVARAAFWATAQLTVPAPMQCHISHPGSLLQYLFPSGFLSRLLLSWLWPCSPGPCGHHGRVTEDIFMSRNACKKSNENTIKHNQVLSAGLSVYRGPAKVGKKRNRDNPGHLGRRFMQLIQNISWNIFWRKKIVNTNIMFNEFQNLKFK